MILCCGEALIDMLPRQTEDGALAFSPFPGGAVFNTAVALARLGTSTGLFTGLSSDLFGTQLEGVLRGNGVNADLAIRSDRPTTLAFVRLIEGQAEYAFYDENTAGRMLNEDELPTELPGVQALFFGGISLAVEPCAAAYQALCLREAARLPVMLDPNVRPGFIADEARYRARIDAMIAVADIVKLSDEDLRWLEGPGEDLAELAGRIRARGPAVVCITEGAKGVTAYHAGGRVFVPALKAEVVDTVGAGDTFNAGLMAHLSEAGALDKAALRSLPEGVLTAALTLGNQAAAITVSRAGANPPRRDELA
ncbi:MAG: carbohydrate kinase [Pseudomonadota bacterium]